MNRLCSFHGVVCREGNVSPRVKQVQYPCSSTSLLCDLGQIFNFHMHEAECGEPTVMVWKLNMGNYLTHKSSEITQFPSNLSHTLEREPIRFREP